MYPSCRLFGTVLLAAAALGAQAAERVVLAVPASHLLVNFAFDVADLAPRDLDLVCYGARPGADTPVELNVFNRVEWRWVAIDLAAWQRGVGLRSGAAHLILVEGEPQSDALQETRWAKSVQTVDGRQLSNVANAAGKLLRFAPEQWRTLADTYGFKLDDRNANVRRYGRYGPSGRARSRPQPVPVAPVVLYFTPDEPSKVALPIVPTAVSPVPPAVPPAPESDNAEAAPAPPVAAPAVTPRIMRPEDK